MPSVMFADDPMPSRSIDSEFAAYLHNSNDVVCMKLVRKPEDFKDQSKEFHPAMTHQIYNEEEIFGYKEVAIKLFFTSASLKIYLNVKTAGSLKNKKSVNFASEIQDVEKPIRDILPEENVYFNSNDFIKLLDDEAKFKPYGDLVHSFSKADQTYEIYHCEVATCPAFKQFHDRLQTFILFFIDGASYIDIDDAKWQFFVLYEKYKSDGDGNWRYAVTGYATVYEYYAYPDKKRPRISQFLILPPWQRKGLGAELLQSVYRYYRGKPSVIDITVEDPSDEFQMLRHYVDSSLCRKLPAFQKEKIREGFSQDMVKEALEAYKLNARQVRRIYEILRLGATNINDEEDLRQYRLEIKKRFFAGNKESARAVKFSSAGAHKDVKELMQATCDPQVMKTHLKEAFDSVYPIYLDIWRKIERSEDL